MGLGKSEATSQTSSGMRSSMSRTDSENSSVLHERRERSNGQEKERMNLKAVNKYGNIFISVFTISFTELFDEAIYRFCLHTAERPVFTVLLGHAHMHELFSVLLLHFITLLLFPVL